MDEIAMELLDDLGMVEHGFGHEGAGLQVAAPLELEYVALGTDHRSRGEAFEERLSLRFLRIHGGPLRMRVEYLTFGQRLSVAASFG